ncbi:MAG: hypothetical protein ACQEWV_18135 [Bacillota bacterium]
MKTFFSKWWIWGLIVLFIIINLLVTNGKNPENDNESNENRIYEGNIDTH